MIPARHIAAIFGLHPWIIGVGKRPKYGPFAPKRYPKRGPHRRHRR